MVSGIKVDAICKENLDLQKTVQNKKGSYFQPKQSLKSSITPRTNPSRKPA